MSQPLSDEPAAADGPVVFFDGFCGLCNRAVDLLLRNDRDAQLLFAPLQGTTASDQLVGAKTDSIDSLVYRDAVGFHTESTAVVRILWQLGRGWNGLGWMLAAVPRPLRNWMYRLVAKLRFRVFGRRDECRIPTLEERGRFLD